MEGFLVLFVLIFFIVLITRASAEERKRVKQERSRNYKSSPISTINNKNKLRDYLITIISSSAITKNLLKNNKGEDFI